MPWLKVDDSMPSHPKVRAIPRAHRMRVLGVWLVCGAWSAHHLTDGFVPAGVIEDEGGRIADAVLLVNCGLWAEVEGGYQFHDWSQWQPARQEVLDARAKEAARKAAWRAAKAAERDALEAANR